LEGLSKLPTASSIDWFHEERRKNTVTIVLFFKTEESVFDRRYLKEWDKLADDIAKEGGKIYAITSSAQYLADAIKIHWNLKMDTLGDELNKLAKTQDVLLSPHPNYPHGRVHTSLIVNTPRRQLYKWTYLETSKVQSFPDPIDVWKIVKSKLQNTPDAPPIKMGCPLTRMGWSEERKNYKYYRAPLNIRGNFMEFNNGRIEFVTDM